MCRKFETDRVSVSASLNDSTRYKKKGDRTYARENPTGRAFRRARSFLPRWLCGCVCTIVGKTDKGFVRTALVCGLSGTAADISWIYRTSRRTPFGENVRRVFGTGTGKGESPSQEGLERMMLGLGAGKGRPGW